MSEIRGCEGGYDNSYRDHRHNHDGWHHGDHGHCHNHGGREDAAQYFQHEADRHFDNAADDLLNGDFSGFWRNESEGIRDQNLAQELGGFGDYGSGQSRAGGGSDLLSELGSDLSQGLGLVAEFAPLLALL